MRLIEALDANNASWGPEEGITELMGVKKK